MKLIKPITLVSVLLIACVATSCLPIPHTTERSADVQGRVLDARTRAPVQGARVCLVQPPHHATYTDTYGHFRLKATRNFHLGYPIPEGHWPNRKDNYVAVTHTDYLPYGFDDNIGGNVGDIFLKPKP